MDEQIINAVREHPILFDPRLKGYKDRLKKSAAWKLVAATVQQSEEECQHRWKSLRDKFVREKRKMDNTKTSGSGAFSDNVWPLMGIMEFLRDTVAHRTSIGNMAKECSASPSNETARSASPLLQALATGGLPEPEASALEAVPSLVDAPHLEDVASGSSALALPEPPCSPACAPGKRKRKVDNSEKYLMDMVKSSSDFLSQRLKQKPVVLDEEDHFLMSLKPSLQRLSLRKRSFAKIQILELLHTLNHEENE